MWRLIYLLLAGTVVLTWQAVRVSVGATAPPLTTAPATASVASHSVALDAPLWSTATMSQTALRSHGVTLVIPRLHLRAPVYDRGLDARGLLSIAPGYAVTHFQDSAAPGMDGNYVAYGHDDIQGQVFQHLSLLHAGDVVELYQGGQHFMYQVDGSRVVAPSAVEVLRPSAGPTLTLISCTPYMVDTARLVVTAALTRVN